MKYAADMTQLVGQTPLVRINKINPGPGEIYAKLEMFNPFSVKDRPAMAMLAEAEQNGLLKPGDTIVEPTSGNTGIGLAFAAAVKGYKIILTMPENMSAERVRLLRALGAEIVLTPAGNGMKGAIAKAQSLLKEIPGAYMPDQFANPNNAAAHEQTGREIEQALDGRADCFIAGVGTGGTITGVGRFLKKKNPKAKIIAVEPADSAVLEGKPAGPHKLQGIGAGFVPEILDRSVIDEIMAVTSAQAAQTARIMARQEGILAGISGGAAMWAALETAKRREFAGKNIVVLLPDGGERYLSTWLYEETAQN